MTTEENLVNLDPYNSDGPKYLSGIKVALGYKATPVCPAADSGDTAARFPWNFADGTKFKGKLGISGSRGQTVNICEYRNTNREQAVNKAGKHDEMKKLKSISKPWYDTNINSTVHGCQRGKNVTVGARRSGTGDFYHQIFPWDKSCPPWSQPIAGVPDMNYDCRGPAPMLCGQKNEDVLDCCLGRKSSGNCRKDQKPQTPFCDSFMFEYCRVHPDSPHCTCITPVPPDVQNKFNITVGQECWYAPCTDNLKNADDAKRSYMTELQLKKSNSGACPTINIVDCSQVGNTVLTKGMNYVSNDQNCSITTSDGVGGDVVKKSKSGNPMGTDNSRINEWDAKWPSKFKLLMLAGGGISVLLLILLLVLATSS